MNFFGIDGLEFLLLFGVAMFFLGPKRLAEGVRTGRKYYTELKRYRQELASLVTEAIDAEELKKDMEQVKKDAWDERVTQEIAGIEQDLTLDQGDLDIMRSVQADRTTSKAKAMDRGDGKVGGSAVPSMDLESGGSSPAPEPEIDADSKGFGSA
jgi:Sec-independent protein translocase protein TatA